MMLISAIRLGRHVPARGMPNMIVITMVNVIVTTVIDDPPDAAGAGVVAGHRRLACPSRSCHRAAQPVTGWRK